VPCALSVPLLAFPFGFARRHCYLFSDRSLPVLFRDLEIGSDFGFVIAIAIAIAIATGPYHHGHRDPLLKTC